MAVSKKLKAIYMGFFDGTELFFANQILKFQERRDLRKYNTITPPQKDFDNQVVAYWKRWKKKVSPKWAWYYASRNGIMDPRYIPHDLYYTKIDQHFNNRKLGWGFNDKNYYSRIFAGFKQPETIARNIGGIFEDGDYRLISVDMILERIKAEGEVICKPALETGSGRSIQFWNYERDRNDIETFLNDRNEKDFIIQKIIHQHPKLDEVHKGSINSLRIVTLLMQDGVHVLSSNLRMGVDQSRIDNVTAGGISAGINPDGSLKDYATNYFTGEKSYTHPQGLTFKGFVVPCYDKAVELVTRGAELIPHFRLVSWDVAIDAEGDAVLIEANMRKGGINLNQFNNGPLFGDLTEVVLDEVFGK